MDIDQNFVNQHQYPHDRSMVGSQAPTKSMSTSATASNDNVPSSQTTNAMQQNAEAVVRQPRPRGRPPTRQPQTDGQLRFPCEYRFSDGSICQKSFNRKSDRERHHHTHTNTRNHPCLLCDKAFIQTSALKVHVRTHTKEKPHHCGICQKRFSDSSSLARHRRTHGPPQFACTWCSTKYKTTQLLQRHERTCPQCQIGNSAQASQFTSPGNVQPPEANFDHTQLWQPTIASHPASRRSSTSIQMNNGHVQFAEIDSDHAAHFRKQSQGQIEDGQLDQAPETQIMNQYTPASSFASDGHSQDVNSSSHISPGTIAAEVQQHDVHNVPDYSQPPQMMSSSATHLLQFQSNLEQQHADLGMREYTGILQFNPRPAEEAVHAIYLDDESGAPNQTGDYHGPQMPQSLPMVVPQQPLQHFNTMPGMSQAYYAIAVDVLDPYKICGAETGFGDVLPSSYDMNQGY